METYGKHTERAREIYMENMDNTEETHGIQRANTGLNIREHTKSI